MTAQQIAFVAAGFILGSIIWDILWRITNTWAHRLIDAQREEIDTLSARCRLYAHALKTMKERVDP